MVVGHEKKRGIYVCLLFDFLISTVNMVWLGYIIIISTIKMKKLRFKKLDNQLKFIWGCKTGRV